MDELKEQEAIHTPEENERQEAIHEKGFDLFSFSSSSPMQDSNNATEYKAMKVGVKKLEDAVLELGTLRSHKLPYCSKHEIISAIINKDYRKLRAISEFFYNVSGIYQTVCNYFAFLYRYDWYVYPENVKESAKNEKIIDEYIKLLNYLDNSYIKKLCGEIALKVIKYGCYYGYLIENNDCSK